MDGRILLFLVCFTLVLECRADCTDTWKLHPNILLFGGEEVNGVNTLIDCKTSCLQNSGCAALNFDNRNKICHIFDCLSKAIIAAPKAVDTHEIIRCEVQAPPPIAPQDTPCKDRFKRIDNARVSGGKLISGASNEEACKEACLTNSSCVGFDFDVANNCYLHYGGDGSQSRVSDSTHFRRAFTCGATTPAVTEPTLP